MGYMKIVRNTLGVWAGLLKKSKGFYLRYSASQLLAISMDLVYTLVVAQAFQAITDRAMASGDGLGRLIIGYLAAVAFTVILWGFGENYISNRLQDRLQMHFRRGMLKSMLDAPLYGKSQMEPGDFNKRYSVDMKTAAQFLVRRISSTLVSPLLGGIGSLCLLGRLHPLLAAAALGVGILTFFLQKLPLPHAAQYADAQTAAEGEYASRLHDTAQNLPVLRMFGAIPFLRRRITAANQTIFHTGRKMLGIDVPQRTLILGIPFLQTLAVLTVGGILAGNGALSLGGLLAAVAYGETVCYMFDGVSRGLASVQSGRAAGERVLEVLNLPPQRKKSGESCAAPYVLTAKGVGLTLDGQVLLRDVNLSLKAGEKVAITGASGSGKSTLARLFGGAYEEYDGELAAQRVCYVPSSCRLLRGTLGENISSFAQNPDEKRLEALIFLLRLDGMTQDFSIEAHGDNLSGGQRQRVAIARALYADCDLYIFDEPTASLDPEVGQQVIAGILAWLEDKAVIVITHDERIARQMDGHYIVREKTIA